MDYFIFRGLTVAVGVGRRGVQETVQRFFFVFCTGIGDVLCYIIYDE